MIVTHLSLANFRNYSALELDLPRDIAIFQGGNAQGKSNLLEALHILATTRSHRAANERELINWAALQEPLPVCRLAADVEKAGRKLSLEIAFRPAVPAPGEPREPPPQERRRSQAVQRRIRVNGIVRRAVDLVGQVNAVLFTAQDIDVVGGEPALRRRYLDVMNSQIDPQYLRLLQRYQRVLWQRNRLLHLMAQNQAKPDELSFWDQELVRTGSYLIEQRERAVAALGPHAEAIHRGVSGEQETLTLVYIKSIGKEDATEPVESGHVSERFARALQALRSKELALGMSLVGPHRDDLRFLSNGNNVGVFGSRGQQRTVALSMRLAEARFITERTGDQPVLLLDDVLSELDARRRQHLLSSVSAYQQVLMTTTELEPFDPAFLEKAVRFRVNGGRIEPLPP